jgi:hypothetical protein
MNSEIQNQYYPSIKQSAGLILKMTLLSIPVAIPFVLLSLFLKYLKPDATQIDSIIFLLMYIAVLVIVIRIGLSSFRETNQSDYRLKFRKISLKTMAILLVVLISAIFITEPLDYLIPMPDAFRDFMLKLLQPNIFSFLSVAVAAPILEELLFRGIILEGFLRNYSPQKAIIWSAVIFGLAHLNPWQAFGAIAIGLLIGWLYWKTDSLLPGIFLHFANNLLAYLLTFSINSTFESFYMLINNWVIYGIIFGIALGILMGGIYLLNKNFLKNHSSPS